MKKLIPAICMLLVTAVMLGSSTFAWFSMNNTVKVTGMEVTTKVSNNLYIADSTAGTTKAADSAFMSAFNKTTSPAVSLQPVSTVNGVDYFYTYEAEANGALSDGGAFTAVSDNSVKDSSSAEIGKAYADYVFELKAMNSGSTDEKVVISKINLLYNNASVSAETAYRVAVFVQNLAASKTAYEAFGTEADGIYSLAGATNQTVDKAVANNTTNVYDDCLDTVNNAGETVILTAPAGETSYFKVTVRLWLEGEDTTCTSGTFMDLTGAWSLDLELKLVKEADAASAAVTAITTVANATADQADGVTLDSDGKLDNGETPATANGFAWYKVGNSTAIAGATTAAFPTTGVADGDKVYCVITTTKGNTYKTNIIVAEIPAP